LKIDEYKRAGGVRPAARTGLDIQTIVALEAQLTELLAFLRDPKSR
jgi:hypothetical protein